MSEDLRAAGELIAFGLDPRLTPGRHPPYAELIARFRGDRAFQYQVETIAAGQGLDILDCSPLSGLVLAASGAQSPYHLRLDEYATMTAEQRHLNAFVFLVIATACYPTPEALELEDGPLPQVTVSQVIRLMNRMAERMRGAAGDVDPPVAEPQLEPVYRLVLRWREGDTTSDERSNPHVKAGMVRRAFRWLAANGLAEEVTTAKNTFRIRSRFRLHVKDAAASVGGSLAHLRDLVRADAP